VEDQSEHRPAADELFLFRGCAAQGRIIVIARSRTTTTPRIVRAALDARRAARPTPREKPWCGVPCEEARHVRRTGWRLRDGRAITGTASSGAHALRAAPRHEIVLVELGRM